MQDTINYTISGNGKPLLLIHGWAMNSGVWGNISKHLSSKYQVIEIDLRGHGKSKHLTGSYNYDTFAQDIRNLIKKLNLKDLTLTGWSMGVSIILKMLGQSLPGLKSLVFISGNPSLVKREDYEHGIPEVVVKRLYKQTDRDLGKGLQNFHKLLFTDQERSAFKENSIYKIITDINSTPSKEAALESLACLQNEDLRSKLDRIDVPTLLIQGKNDQISLPDASAYMNNYIKGSELVLLEDTGHVPFLTKEKEVLEKITFFLETA